MLSLVTHQTSFNFDHSSFYEQFNFMLSCLEHERQKTKGLTSDTGELF